MSQHAGKFTRKLAYEAKVPVRALRRCFRNTSDRQRRHLYLHPSELVATVAAGAEAKEILAALLRVKNQLRAKVRAGTKLSRGQSKLAAAWARARKIQVNEKKGGKKE